MRFVETPVFTSSLRGLLSAEEHRQLQIALLLRPEQGPLIRGSGGLRKLRWGATGRGKRGGLRLIYYWEPSDELFYMLYIYPKNVQDDLTPAQVRTLRQLVEEELK
jgi:mRNA-degrading endonuclease RelE of RelBE toxin-antitoxin system